MGTGVGQQENVTGEEMAESLMLEGPWRLTLRCVDGELCFFTILP